MPKCKTQKPIDGLKPKGELQKGELQKEVNYPKWKLTYTACEMGGVTEGIAIEWHMVSVPYIYY
jgi:hypothetical protein